MAALVDKMVLCDVDRVSYFVVSLMNMFFHQCDFQSVELLLTTIRRRAPLLFSELCKCAVAPVFIAMALYHSIHFCNLYVGALDDKKEDGGSSNMQCALESVQNLTAEQLYDGHFNVGPFLFFLAFSVNVAHTNWTNTYTLFIESLFAPGFAMEMEQQFDVARKLTIDSSLSSKETTPVLSALFTLSSPLIHGAIWKGRNNTFVFDADNLTAGKKVEKWMTDSALMVMYQQIRYCLTRHIFSNFSMFENGMFAFQHIDDLIMNHEIIAYIKQNTTATEVPHSMLNRLPWVTWSFLPIKQFMGRGRQSGRCFIPGKNCDRFTYYSTYYNGSFCYFGSMIPIAFRFHQRVGNSGVQRFIYEQKEEAYCTKIRHLETKVGDQLCKIDDLEVDKKRLDKLTVLCRQQMDAKVLSYCNEMDSLTRQISDLTTKLTEVEEAHKSYVLKTNSEHESALKSTKLLEDIKDTMECYLTHDVLKTPTMLCIVDEDGKPLQTCLWAYSLEFLTKSLEKSLELRKMSFDPVSNVYGSGHVLFTCPALTKIANILLDFVKKEAGEEEKDQYDAARVDAGALEPMIEMTIKQSKKKKKKQKAPVVGRAQFL